MLCGESGSNFVSLPVDDVYVKEKEKLEAANDDLGLSLLFAAKKVLLVHSGTRVKVLKAFSLVSCWEVRVRRRIHRRNCAGSTQMPRPSGG